MVKLCGQNHGRMRSRAIFGHPKICEYLRKISLRRFKSLITDFLFEVGGFIKVTSRLGFKILKKIKLDKIVVHIGVN